MSKTPTATTSTMSDTLTDRPQAAAQKQPELPDDTGSVGSHHTSHSKMSARTATVIEVVPQAGGRLPSIDSRAVGAMVRITFYCNLLLFFVKLFAFINSFSMAVLASLADSSVDLMAQSVLMFTSKMAASKGTQKATGEEEYPVGRSRLEPVGVILCSAMMVFAALQVVKESIDTLVANQPAVTTSITTISLIGGVIVLKILLYIVCRHVMRSHSSPTLEATTMDNWNDILSNSATLIAVVPALVDASQWIWDPIGAILISVYIIYSWVSTANEQVEMLVGKKASPSFLDVVREMAETHDPVVVPDVVRAYHFGPKFLVELEVVMPEDTSLVDSHDVGIALQHKIEGLDEVERCFVHIDYRSREEDDHNPDVPIENKIAKGVRQRTSSATANAENTHVAQH